MPPTTAERKATQTYRARLHLPASHTPAPPAYIFPHTTTAHTHAHSTFSSPCLYLPGIPHTPCALCSSLYASVPAASCTTTCFLPACTPIHMRTRRRRNREGTPCCRMSDRDLDGQVVSGTDKRGHISYHNIIISIHPSFPFLYIIISFNTCLLNIEREEKGREEREKERKKEKRRKEEREGRKEAVRRRRRGQRKAEAFPLSLSFSSMKNKSAMTL